tara:strand:- start:5536 stop:6282 length:747 start_codon:yes stop_codon:yes gene_type:complete
MDLRVPSKQLFFISIIQFFLKGISSLKGIRVMNKLVSTPIEGMSAAGSTMGITICFEPNFYLESLIISKQVVLLVFIINTIDFYKDCYLLKKPNTDSVIHHFITYFVIIKSFIMDIRMLPYFAAIMGTFEIVGPFYQIIYILKLIKPPSTQIRNEDIFYKINFIDFLMKILIVILTIWFRLIFFIYVLFKNLYILGNPICGGSFSFLLFILLTAIIFIYLDVIWSIKNITKLFTNKPISWGKLNNKTF